MAERNERVLMLFDVDGTLTPPRKCMSKDVEDFLKVLKTHYKVGVVGGSDLVKIKEQMGKNIDVIEFLDYVFAENGLVAYKNGSLISEQSMVKHLGEGLVQRVINFSLNHMSQLTLPVKRGTFVEFRSGMLNLCPVGRSCSQAERDQFSEYDKVHGIRENFVKSLQKEFRDADLEFAIGGQISIDVYPRGWHKCFCLTHIDPSEFDEIHFFGDKCFEGGNDYAIYEDPRTIGHSVTSPEHTLTMLKELFFK